MGINFAAGHDIIERAMERARKEIEKYEDRRAWHAVDYYTDWARSQRIAAMKETAQAIRDRVIQLGADLIQVIDKVRATKDRDRATAATRDLVKETGQLFRLFDETVEADAKREAELTDTIRQFQLASDMETRQRIATQEKLAAIRSICRGAAGNPLADGLVVFLKDI